MKSSNKRNLHSILIHLTCLEYLITQLEDETYNKDFVLRIKTLLNGYLVFHRLSDKEAEILTELGKDKYMINLREVQINYGLFAMELLVLHQNKLSINVSKKKILQYKSNLVMDMLKLKHRDDAMYSRVKSTVDDSRITAKSYYSYTEEMLNDSDNR